MKTSDLTNDELLEYFSEHIRYEVQMLLNAAVAISNEFEIPRGLEHTPVESFAIHLRNLISFLYPQTKRDNDVCAIHFFTEAKNWERIRPDLSDKLNHAKTRADKEVGHLTTLRQSGTPETKRWDVIDLCKEIMPILKLFCKSTDKIKLDIAFEELWNYYSIRIS